MKIMSVLIMIAILFAGCARSPNNAPSSTPAHPIKTFAEFPALPSIDNTVYAQIKKTCGVRWQLENMKMDTFTVVPDRDKYLVKCDGVEDGEIYRCTIRVDGDGNWINDGRTKKTP